MNYRPQWLAEGVEDLLSALDHSAHDDVDFDVVVVGSGYGGAVAAARLAQAAVNDTGKRLTVCVLERGQEYVPGTFPGRLSELPGCVRFSRFDDPEFKGTADGLFDFRLGADISVLVGNGLGGGSLINASVAERAKPDVFEDPAWPAELRRDLDTLDACYYRAECMLGVSDADAEDLAKYRALGEFAKAAGASVRPARIAVNSTGGMNAHGIMQGPCLDTGNCVTGCNNWAKNTLAMNYLPLAKRFGARLFVNTTVMRVEKVAGGGKEVLWQVRVRQTSKRHPQADENRVVRARHVVLAAGTLGSTEILMRSRAPKLRFSEKLGTRFSGNGDMISVLHGQRSRVNAAPEDTAPIARGVGPTITGVVETGTTRADRVVIEDLGIPSPLRRVFEEIVTTGALPAALGRFDWSRHRPGGTDPAAVNTNAIERTQIFAAMGDDGARGRLEMVEGWESAAGNGAIKVEWKGAGADPLYLKQDKILSKSESLGGTYLRSPLWKPLPEDVSSILSGRKPEGKLLSVHPLGGCAMGDDWKSGVVDDIGRVYDPADGGDYTRTHHGLLVLDGAIVPTALGINPLLTITALAERAVARYARFQAWTIDYDETRGAKLPNVPGLPEVQPAPKAITSVRFAEKMTGNLELVPDPKKAFSAKLEVEFGEIGDIRNFLRQGPHRVRLKKATLVVDDGEPATVSGIVYWMERGRTNWFGRLLRAGWTWLCTRAFSDFFQQRREGRPFELKALWMAFKLALKLASNVGEVRYLRYEMKLRSALMRDDVVVLPAKTRIRGLKTLEYVRDGNPWTQLSELKVTVTPPRGVPREAGTLKIDLAHMVRRFAGQLQIVRNLDQPTAILDVAAIGLFLARIVLKVHFWSFRLPEYEKHDPERDRRRMPGALDGLTTDRDQVFVAGKGGNLVLPLTRYRRDLAPGQPPVLLIHGFGSGGIQFAHPKLERNLARHLAEKGFDVWVAELRTSIALPESFNQWTLDEVAREDIPAIVQHVLDVTDRTQLDVVAHCIGSAMFCTAVLDGRLGQKVRSAVLLQVGPLIKLSKGNEFRAYLAAALRRYMLANFMYSSVDSSADWRDAVLDRILYTYPYPKSERRAHALCPPWKPDTHIANCNRSAGVFGRLFQHENVGDTMRDALGDLLGHTNLRTFEQTGKYAFAKRLTDYDGCNAYVTDENVGRYFDFPVRFLHGKQNDVFHPDTTAKSLEMLKRVFGPGHCADRVEFDTYGHLDPLIGDTAESDVYGSISEFLELAGMFSRGTRLKTEEYSARRPIIGPLLGWTRKENGQWKARIWCRCDDEESDAYFIIAVVLDAQGKPVKDFTVTGPVRGGQGTAAGVPDLLAVVDVTLPQVPGDYEIVVVGAYARVKPAQSKAQVDVQAAANLAQPVEAEAADEKARMNAQAPGGPMDGYAKAVIEERAVWSKAMGQGTKARRVCDRGYEEPPDSVLLPRVLLERLDSARAQPEFNFALGSCRYSATMIDREQADATFGRLRALIENKTPGAPSLLLLAGDQIYADATAGLFDPKDRRARFYDAYREVWTAPNAREVLRRLPSYMMLDDHEVSDDWHPEDQGDKDYQDNRTWGLNAFEEYQLAHSPNNALALCAAAGVAPPATAAYFYSFEAGGYAFFACDTRTGRKGREQIMSPVQFAALKNWLKEKQQDPGYADKPKFVLSPSVVVPFLKATRGSDAYAARSDGWDGFPYSLRELFSFIARERIGNVVFLCGDPHLSMSSEIYIEGKGLPDLRALCIVASPFYAPYPFANAKPEDFAEVGAIPLYVEGGASMRYSRTPCVVGDSFTLVGVRPNGNKGWSVSASVHGRAGVTANPPFPLP